jgi:hypothetical protein
MSSSERVISGRRPSARGLIIAIAVLAAVAALAVLVIRIRPVAMSPNADNPAIAVASTLFSPVYPTQRENGLPAYDHGR